MLMSFSPDPNTLDWATGDLKQKGAHQGPEPRKQRKLSPEMEKQFNEATPLSAFLRNTANAFSLNQADRLATITGAPLEEQHELPERLIEKFPKSSIFGGVVGSAVPAARLSQVAARAAPAVFGRNTFKSAALREGTVGAGTAAQVRPSKRPKTAAILARPCPSLRGCLGAPSPRPPPATGCLRAWQDPRLQATRQAVHRSRAGEHGRRGQVWRSLWFQGQRRALHGSAGALHRRSRPGRVRSQPRSA